MRSTIYNTRKYWTVMRDTVSNTRVPCVLDALIKQSRREGGESYRVREWGRAYVEAQAHSYHNKSPGAGYSKLLMAH